MEVVSEKLMRTALAADHAVQAIGRDLVYERGIFIAAACARFTRLTHCGTVQAPAETLVREQPAPNPQDVFQTIEQIAGGRSSRRPE